MTEALTNAVTVSQGEITIRCLPEWAEGTRLQVIQPGPGVIEIREDDEQPDSPEEIARWIAEFQSIPPIEMTAAGEAAWNADRKRRREVELQTFENRIDSLIRDES